MSWVNVGIIWIYIIKLVWSGPPLKITFGIPSKNSNKISEYFLQNLEPKRNIRNITKCTYTQVETQIRNFCLLRFSLFIWIRKNIKAHDKWPSMWIKEGNERRHKEASHSSIILLAWGMMMKREEEYGSKHQHQHNIIILSIVNSYSIPHTHSAYNVQLMH
jgi:hypothetical protein